MKVNIVVVFPQRDLE